MLWLLISATTLMLNLANPKYDYVPTVEEYESPHEYEPQLMHITGYINPNGNPTASGGNTFIGSCAMNRANLGKVVAIYDKEKKIIGYYDCNDIGGTDGLKNGKVVDIFFEDMQTLTDFFQTYGTELYVQVIEGEG